LSSIEVFYFYFFQNLDTGNKNSDDDDLSAEEESAPSPPTSSTRLSFPYSTSDGHNVTTSSGSSTGPQIIPRTRNQKSKSSPIINLAPVSRLPGAHRGSTTASASSTTSMAKKLVLLLSI